MYITRKIGRTLGIIYLKIIYYVNVPLFIGYLLSFGKTLGYNMFCRCVELIHFIIIGKFMLIF